MQKRTENAELNIPVAIPIIARSGWQVQLEAAGRRRFFSLERVEKGEVTKLGVLARTGRFALLSLSRLLVIRFGMVRQITPSETLVPMAIDFSTLGESRWKTSCPAN